VKRLLAGERGHYGPLEHAQIVLNVGWFPHSVMQQARTHRVGVSFDVQSMRYTGDRICKAANGELSLDDVFYLRPVGDYSDRQGKKYHYSAELRQQDLELCQQAAARYRDLLQAGFAEEHARGILPFDYRQHFVVSFSLRAFLHFMDLRAKGDESRSKVARHSQRASTAAAIQPSAMALPTGGTFQRCCPTSASIEHM
jgi:thymidylate synthase (FAD)